MFDFFNLNLHRIMEKYRSAAAEVIYSVIDKDTNHINYLEGKIVILFMKVVFVHLMTCGSVRDKIFTSLSRGRVHRTEIYQYVRMFVQHVHLHTQQRLSTS